MQTLDIISKKSIKKQLERVKSASRKLLQLQDAEITDIITYLAALIIREQETILAANQKDLDQMAVSDPLYDRLLLDAKRLENIAADLRKVAQLPSPLHQVLEERTLPNDLQLSKISVPLGVIGIVYEARPNVTFDVFALTLKSGNASVLKGSRHAHYSNLAIIELIHKALAKYNLQDACYLMPSERAALAVVLSADQYIDIIIPRGGQGLIQFVREQASVPVIETGAGIVHTYFDKSADLNQGKAIIENAKARRVSVCNALDTLLIHKDRITDLNELLSGLDQKHHCEVFADERAYQQLQSTYSKERLQLARAADFGTEFLSMKMSIKVVDDLEMALDHIAQYSSQHSEAIVAEDTDTVDIFLKNVDAAVVYANTSTAFTDGAQFGLGAEIGISTQKLHARGPMGLRALTSYKWVVRGSGQVRK
ncbi:MAG: glutamate-5-semialdehyde dehydrogenase [Bacteroidota bacterium]